MAILVILTQCAYTDICTNLYIIHTNGKLLLGTSNKTQLTSFHELKVV